MARSSTFRAPVPFSSRPSRTCTPLRRLRCLPTFVRTPPISLPAKIRVNGIAPGTIDTDMVRNNTPEAQEAMAQAALLNRAAHPDELVGLALYLASDASSFVTGATFHIDGGLVSR